MCDRHSVSLERVGVLIDMLFQLFYECSRSWVMASHCVLILFSVFPVFPARKEAIEQTDETTPMVNTENTGNLRNPLRRDWEQTGNKTGNTGNIFISGDLPIPPFEPAALTLPVPQPALRPQTTRGTNLVRLRPLRLRLVDAFLQDF